MAWIEASEQREIPKKNPEKVLDHGLGRIYSPSLILSLEDLCVVPRSFFASWC
jgi:hypothetical protein